MRIKQTLKTKKFYHTKVKKSTLTFSDSLEFNVER